MPDMDGFETCRRLQRQERTRDIPVIFMTALDNVAHKVRGFQVGAVDYVTKPIQLEELFVRVTTHVRLRALQTELAAHNQTLARQNQQLTTEIAERQRAQAELLAAHAELQTTLQHLQHTQDSTD
jgi:DNA-binding response OmpR family regulator